MNTATLIVVTLAIILTMMAYFRGGVHWKGLERGGHMLLDNLLLLLASFVMAGMIQVLIPRELILEWLGTEAGFKGIILGCVAGALTPGPPYAVFPIVGSLYQSGATLGAVVGFVTGKALWSVTVIPTEAALIGPRAAAVRVAATLIVPPLAGLFAQHVLGRLIQF